MAIIGLGGTGSYILDLLAKVPIGQIHQLLNWRRREDGGNNLYSTLNWVHENLLRGA